MVYADRIVVEDACGCRFDVNAYRRSLVLSLALKFKLETGEAVRQLDCDRFVIERTGEALVRVNLLGT